MQAKFCTLFFIIVLCLPSSFALSKTSEIPHRLERFLSQNLGIQADVRINKMMLDKGIHKIAATVNGLRVVMECACKSEAITILSVRVLEPLTVLGEQEWVDRLSSQLGIGSPQILAVAAMSATQEAGERWQLWLKSGDKEGQMLQVVKDKNENLKLQEFTYDEQAFRALASPLAIHAALDLVKSFEAPLNQLGALEVLLKSRDLSEKEYSFVTYENSPIGFDVRTEKQLLLPPLVSDNAAYVTINTQTGKIRAELFN